jgi:CRISPR/Cas system-associated protein Cas7 (RAMP superfamily)
MTTTEHIASTVIWGTLVVLFVGRWLVYEWEWYRERRRERRKKLLQDITQLERELGIGEHANGEVADG